MKMRKKICALFLTLTCVTSMVPLASAAGGGYADVPASHWAYDVITKWSQDASGVFEGNGDGIFSPGQELTLGDVATILSRYFNYTARTEADVTPAWADEYVEKLIAAGVLDAAAQVDASVVVTREQAVKYFALAFGIAPVDDATTFVDDESISEAYKPYVNAFQRLGYVEGKGGNVFDPKASYTRAEAAKLLDNITKPGIAGVTAIGFVDTDGAKLSAIAVEYNVDLKGAAVSADTFDIDVYNAGSNNIGDITKVYINNEPEISAQGGTGAGNYVIIEVYTDYMLSSEQDFELAMAVGVTQKADIKCGSTTIKSSQKEIVNYVEEESAGGFGGMGGGMGGGPGGGGAGGGMGGSGGGMGGSGGTKIQKKAIFGTYTITSIEGFRFYTNLDTYGTPDGPAFHVEHCFDEKDGNYYDFDVSYALYVPENYKPSGSYAMVIVDNPAAEAGTHPLTSVLQTRSPALLASDWGQEQVKANHGLDGLIVVVPVVEARVDDNACTPGQYEALVALWDHIRETYSIDENHVYAIGQSVGGMVLMETNRNRDNYFAGILMFENQWAQNYYKDGLFIRDMATKPATAATAPWHYPRTDAEITWDFYYDEAGNKVTEDHDPYNLYYLVSDDNIMVMNRSGNNLSNNTWRELSYLYSDLVGYELKQCVVDGNASIEEQEAAIQAYLDAGNTYNGQEMGLRWVTFQNGSNGYSARKVLSGYEWLLSQTREDEMKRSKLDVNKPFEIADEQIQTEERMLSYKDTEGNPIYYKTAKAGAGTQNYNTSWLPISGVADAAPGWLPEGMSWETGVEVAKIEGVTAINANGKLTAVAIRYNVDMKDLVINLKGDAIIGLDGNIRDDIKIILDPYEFYDASGNKIDCTIKNVYVNSSASVVAGAERGSGEGSYVIVELDTSSTATSVGVIQRTTVRTNTAIATAIDELHK